MTAWSKVFSTIRLASRYVGRSLCYCVSRRRPHSKIEKPGSDELEPGSSRNTRSHRVRPQAAISRDSTTANDSQPPEMPSSSSSRRPHPRSNDYDYGLGPSTTGGRADMPPEDDLSLLETSIMFGGSRNASPKDMTVKDLISMVMQQDIVQTKKLAKKVEKTGMDVDEAVQAVENPNDKRQGPLHMAALIGYTEMCRMLVKDFKCSVDMTDGYGATPLIFAIQGVESEAVVRYLISAHADPNKANNRGITPLHLVAEQGNCAIAQLLLSNGAIVDPLCKDGEAPLHVAARNRNVDMVTLQLEHGADCNRISGKHETPIVAALFGSSLECLEILIEAGADVNAGSHVTPLTVAAGKGLTDCTNCLLRNGANPNEPDASGKTPMEIAASKGWSECVEILCPVTNPLAKYAGMDFDQIVQYEITANLHEAARANAHGDEAYKQKNYALASRCYTRALRLGHNDTALYAKRSLCHLAQRDEASALEDAYSYRDFTAPALLASIMQPESSDLPPNQAVMRLVLAYGKKFRLRLIASSYPD